MTRTPNLDLVLYEANDIMDGVEFINDNNGKIDTYCSQTRGIAQSANALAGQANQGVGAADTKINAINSRLSQDEVDSLPQYKTDTDARLDSLEDGVTSFLSPQNVPYTKNGNQQTGMMRSGGLLIYNYGNVITSSTNPNVVPTAGTVYKAYGNITTSFSETSNNFGLYEMATIGNNILNLPDMDKYYVGSVLSLITSSGSRVLVNLSLIAIYNGVNTIIYARLDNSAKTDNSYLISFILPLGIY